MLVSVKTGRSNAERFVMADGSAWCSPRNIVYPKLSDTPIHLAQHGRRGGGKRRQ